MLVLPEGLQRRFGNTFFWSAFREAPWLDQGQAPSVFNWSRRGLDSPPGPCRRSSTRFLPKSGAPALLF